MFLAVVLVIIAIALGQAAQVMVGLVPLLFIGAIVMGAISLLKRGEE